MRKWFGVLAILAAGVFTAVVYSRLPERMPTHWNFSGEVDGWSSRLVGAIMLPLVGLGIFALLQVFPRIDPLKRSSRVRATSGLSSASSRHENRQSSWHSGLGISHRPARVTMPRLDCVNSPSKNGPTPRGNARVAFAFG